MDWLFQGSDRKIWSVFQIFGTSACTTLQYSFVMLISVFLTGIYAVMNAAFDLFCMPTKAEIVQNYVKSCICQLGSRGEIPGLVTMLGERLLTLDYLSTTYFGENKLGYAAS